MRAENDATPSNIKIEYWMLNEVCGNLLTIEILECEEAIAKINTYNETWN